MTELIQVTHVSHGREQQWLFVARDGVITDTPPGKEQYKGMTVEDFGAVCQQKYWAVKMVGSNAPTN